MRSIWNIICVMCVSNVLALGAFAVWLHATGRIDPERASRVREMLQETIAEEKKRLAAEQAELDAAAATGENLPNLPPASASDLLDLRLQDSEIDRQRVERLRREVEDLQAKLRRDQRVLEDQRTEFEKQREEFQAMRDRLRETEGNAQFQRSLAVLEGLKASAAREALVTLIDEGKQDQVVAYLNAMQDRTRTKVVNEFIKDGRADLAAELVEALRMRGVETASAGVTP